MITRYAFELMLEKIAEKFYLNAAANMVSVRGGNSRGNEVYFGNVAPDVKSGLDCQLLILTKKGSCPDSGIFGNFNYKHEDEIDWEAVRNKKIIVLEVTVPNKQKCYIEVDAVKIKFPEDIREDSKNRMSLRLNDLNEYEDFFGVEYKAAVNASSTSINVASFNSTCPCITKTTTLKAYMIHNYPTGMKKNHKQDKQLLKCQVNLDVKFFMYYFIVNDIENGTRSEIKQILLCKGSFFAPNTTELEAEDLSSQVMPKDINKEVNLYRVSLRYRPFFESRSIQSNGFGIYTSWQSRMIGEIAEHAQRQALLAEVEKIQQTLILEDGDQVSSQVVKEEDNVIYLNLKANKILRRAS
jgi:hypothetical protein